MFKLTRDMVCPSCGVVDFTRKHRRFWMRWWRGSRLYQCRHCRSSILLLARRNMPGESTSTPGEY
jgi:DNA-directed RNA polymerase subunit RPC12/RpoP